MSKLNVISAVTTLAIASLSSIAMTSTAIAAPLEPSTSSLTSLVPDGSSLSAGSSSSQSPAEPPAPTVESPIFRAATGIGTNSASVNFSWRTLYSGEEFVRFAPVNDPQGAQQVAANDADFGADEYRSKSAAVSNLKPGVTYSYQLGSEQGGWSEPETFTIDKGGDSWTFLAVSDAQIGVQGRVGEQGKTWRDTVRNATTAHPDSAFILSLGDQVDGSSDPEKLFSQYDEFFSAPELRRYRTAALEGNHEVSPQGAGFVHFKEHWALPNELADTSNFYFEQNNALFIGLNSNFSNNEGLAEQEQFVRDTVAAHGADKDWIVVGSHFAHHSHGGRYDNDSIVRMRNKLGPVFSELGVDVVLNGHDHMYNRSHLINGVDPVIPEKDAAPGDVLKPQDGDVLYVTLNTAGAGKFYDFKGKDGEKYPEMTLEKSRELGLNQPTIGFWNQDRTPDYTVVDVTADTLKIRTHNVYGDSIVDDVTITNPREKKPEASPSGDSSSLSSKDFSGSSLSSR